MKRLVLGDIHGHWNGIEQIYNKEQPDEVIILGDYFDNFHGSDLSIRECWTAILNLRAKHLKAHKGQFIMLIGNHDFHYNHYYEKCSGYRKSMAVTNALALNDNADKLQFVYIDEVNNTIYSHAGVTNTWLRENMGDKFAKDSYKFINEMNHRAFMFTYKGGSDYYGNSIYQSPIWVRPESLNMDALRNEDFKSMTQIVGHTHSDGPICYNWGGYKCEFENLEQLNRNIDDIRILVIDTMPKYYVVEELDDETGKLIKREVRQNELSEV